ncbi:hypothetical protein [Ferrimonas senticii]|uniref:hypothetical protein n=1 Tax=Ferrimonas senticii TaxID=394566 RepID=UPI00042597DC|nr:hypothetical protein [Ferrimonas senticii]
MIGRIWLVAIVLLNGCSSNVLWHEQHQQHLAGLQRVAILPPEVLVEQRFANSDPLPLEGQQQHLRQQLVLEAVTQLERQGVTPLVIEADQQQSAFSQGLAWLKASYQQISHRLHNDKVVSATTAAGFSESVGFQAAQVANECDADALLLLRYHGWQMQGDPQPPLALGLLSSGDVKTPSAQSGERIEAALIDGASGDVIWTSVLSGDDNSGAVIASDFAPLKRVSRKLAGAGRKPQF